MRSATRRISAVALILIRSKKSWTKQIELLGRGRSEGGEEGEFYMWKRERECSPQHWCAAPALLRLEMVIAFKKGNFLAISIFLLFYSGTVNPHVHNLSRHLLVVSQILKLASAVLMIMTSSCKPLCMMDHLIGLILGCKKENKTFNHWCANKIDSNISIDRATNFFFWLCILHQWTTPWRRFGPARRLLLAQVVEQ